MEDFLLMIAAILEEDDYEVGYRKDDYDEVDALMFSCECEDSDRNVSIIGLDDSVLIRTAVIEGIDDVSEGLECINEWNSYYLDYKFVIDEDEDLMMERWCNAGEVEDVTTYGKARAVVMDAKKMCKLCVKLAKELE